MKALKGPHPGRHEKNWMPVVGPSTQQLFVHSTQPSITWGEDSGFVAVTSDRLDYDGPGLRGGSQVIPLSLGYLAVVHEVTWEPQRHYWHRFVYFSPWLAPINISRRFYFNEPGIEFAAGLVEHEDDFVVSFGFRDQQAMLARIPKDAVLGKFDRTL